MHRSGCEGNAESMAVALSACPYAGDLALAKGEATHGCGVMKGVIHGYVFITNSLVCMYGKLGEMDNAKKAFRDATEKNIVTWNTLITSYAIARLCDEALDVLAQMEQIGGTVAPNVVNWSTVIGGFGKRERKNEREKNKEGRVEKDSEKRKRKKMKGKIVLTQLFLSPISSDIIK
jgi:pentatricopeptide repeat protein